MCLLIKRGGTMPKSNSEFKVFTFCDFGDRKRVDLLGRHHTFETAARAYKRVWGIYHRLHGWRVWQSVPQLFVPEELAAVERKIAVDARIRANRNVGDQK